MGVMGFILIRMLRLVAEEMLIFLNTLSGCWEKARKG